MAPHVRVRYLSPETMGTARVSYVPTHRQPVEWSTKAFIVVDSLMLLAFSRYCVLNHPNRDKAQKAQTAC